MTITFEIPEELASQFVPAGQDPARAALEAIALEGYRSERLSESEICRLLGFETRMEVHGFLKQHGMYLHYTVEDLEHDIEMARLMSKQAAAERLARPSTERRAG